jgi:predicted nucleic-acid-binding Zn-ribbon protein
VEGSQKTVASYIDFMSFILVMVNWLYVITCKKCGYISSEKLPELKAKQMVRSHLGGLGNCTRGHVKLVKVRA